MAYNPFDDVILNDPAYMQNGGGVKRTVIPQQRIDYSQGPTAAPFANAITTVLQSISPEPETLEQIERNKQLRSLSTAQALKDTNYAEYAGRPDLPSFVIQAPGIKERLDAAGFVPQSAFEAVSKGGDFLSGDERRAFEKFSRGDKLEQSDINAVAMTSLLGLDAVGLGALGTRLAKFGFKTINDVLKSSSKDPDVLRIRTAFGGSPVPLIQDTAKGPPGMQTTPRVALSPDDGKGVVDLRKDPDKVKQIQATKLKKTQEELFEPYRQNLQDYLAQTNVPSAKGFYNYLTDNKIPLTLEKLNVPGKSIRYKPPQLRKNKNISTETEHLKEAVDYLTEGKSPLKEFRPEWTGIAEKILESSDKKLSNSQIYDELIKAGVPESEITGAAGSKLQKIQEFTKKDYLSDAAKKNVVIGTVDRNIVNAENLKQELVAFKDKLESDPTLQGKGIGSYEKIRGDSLTTILKSYGIGGKRSEDYKDIIEPEFIEEIKALVKIPKESREEGFRQFIPVATKVETTQPGLEGSAAYPTALQKLADAYRTNFKFIDPKTGETTFDFSNLESFEQTAKAYGIEKVATGTSGAKKIRLENQEPILKLARDIEILQNKSGAFTQAQIQGYYDVINESKKLSNYTNNKFRDIIENNPELKEQLVKEYKEYYTKFPKTETVINKQGKKVERKIPVEEMTLDDFINAANRTFDGHVSHVFTIADFPSAGKGLEGVGDISNFVRNNYGIENLALQKRGENAVEAAIRDIRVGLALGEDITSAINTLKYFDKLFTRKGMALYRRIDKEKMPPEVINRINQELKKPNAAGTIADRTKEGKPIPDDIAEKFNDIFLGSEQPLTLEQNIARFDELMDYYIKNPKALVVSKSSIPQRKDLFIEGFEETPYFKRGFIDTSRVNIERDTRFKKGGAVRMAIGGDPLQNINQQQFTPDPAMDDDFFKKAVDTGNLQAFGASNLFKIFGKVPGLLTPKKVVSDVPTGTGAAPMVPNVDPGDFPFKSYFIESTTSPNAPKSALPKDWLKYYTGKIGVPQSEMKDAGILNYLEDIEKFFPNTKLTQQNLIDVYESSPIANIEVKIKREPTGNTPPGSLGAYMGKPTHQGSGSQPLDNLGENYREIVVNVDKLPGQEKQFFNSSHFGKDPNVIAFTRVADYKDVDGNTVAAIQEIQTDMLTNLKKEQERMKGTAVMIRNYKEKLKNQIAQGDTYMQDMLEKIERDYPESMLKFMETSDLVRPNNPTFADQLTPDVVKELTEIQERITTIANQNRARVVDPDFQNKIVALQEEGRQKFNALFELNRGTNYEDQLKNIKILDVDNTEDLERFANANPTYEARFRPVQSFPVLPFNKGKDYIDLLVKATIQDAQANGINKVAIFPSELVNRRWSKDPDGPAGKKFKTIYDNITVQELKNIAKKYTGSKNNLKIEEIVDKSKGELGLRFLNKDVDGNLQVLKETDIDPSVTIRREDLGPRKPPVGLNAFLNEEILRVAKDYGPNEVVFRKEIAPGQTMEYFVDVKQGDVVDQKFDLVPLGDADRAEDATIIIEEYNPQRVKMYTLTLPKETTKQGPMFIYGKKDGGKIASDGLVSITDIFGEY